MHERLLKTMMVVWSVKQFKNLLLHIFHLQLLMLHVLANTNFIYVCIYVACLYSVVVVFFFKNNNFYSIRFVSFRLNSIEFLIATTTVMARPAIVCLHVLKSFVFFFFWFCFVLLWLLPSFLLGSVCLACLW